MKEAINKAHAAQITEIYKTFSQAIFTAQGDDTKIEEAERKFIKGVAHANDAKQRAISIVGDMN